MLGPSPFFPASGGSGGASSGSSGFVGRDIVWVDLRFWPGVGDGSEKTPYNTANLGLGALPDGGTLVMAGGDATAEAGVAIAARSGSFFGFSGQKASGGLAPVLPTLTYAITTGTQRLAFRNISVALVHSGTAASLSEFYFEFCPSVTLTSGGDASPVYWTGDAACSFSGSGGAAKFVGGTIAGYVANGSGTVSATGCQITSDITSSVSVTLVGCTFGGALSITAPSILADLVTLNRADSAGVTFSVTPTRLASSDTPVDIGSANTPGTSNKVANADHGHNLPYPPVQAALGAADSPVSFNNQRLTDLGAPSSPNDAARLVDLTAAAAGLKVKHSALVVATSNQATRSGTAQTIDGVLLSTIGTYVLLIAQTTASQNGPWLIQAGAWIRPVDGSVPANDFSTGSSAAQSYVLVTSGTSNQGNSYFCTNAAGSDVVDTNDLNWTIFNQPPVIIDGDGLVKTGSTFDVVAGDATIVANANDIVVGVIGNTNLADNTITPARLTNAGAQGDFLMRVSSGSGAWEDGTTAQARSALGIFGYGALVPVRAATTANITLSGAQTIDGVSCIAGDRVLAKNQTTGSQNGVYVVAAGAWARATDADGSGELVGGMLFPISEGTNNGNRVAMLTTDDPITIGSTTLTFAMDRVVPVTSTAPVDVTKSAAAIGTDTAAARADHKHDISTAVVTDIGTSNAEGVATSLARSDHVHRLTVTTLVAILATTAASVSVNSQKITSLATPTVSTDAATKGYVDGATWLPAFTGDVTKTLGGTVLTIANDAVTYAKLQNVSATNRFLGRITGGAGDAEELTPANAVSIIASGSGGGTANYFRADGSWATPPGTTVPGGSTTQVQYNNAGAFDGASGIAVVGTETAFAFGSNPATTGILRMSGGSVIALSRHNNANTQNLAVIASDTSDNLFLGDISNGNQLVFDVPSGKEFNFRVASTNVFDIKSASGYVDFHGLAARFGTNPAGAGLLRVPHLTGDDVLDGRNFANNQNVPLIRWGAFVNDMLYLGSTSSDAGKVATLRFGIHTGGAFQWEINGSPEYAADATKFDFKDNYASFGSLPAGSGTAARFSNLQTVYVRNSTNTQDIRVLEMGDNLSVGDGGANGNLNFYHDVKTGGTHIIRVNNSSEYTLDSTKLDLTTNIVVHGASPSANAVFNVSNGDGVIIGVKNSGGTDRSVLAWGGADNIFIGTTSTTTGLNTVGGTWSFGSTASFPGVKHSIATGGYLSFGTNTTGSGLIRTPENVGTIIGAKNYDGTGDQNILYIAGSGSFTDMHFGDGSAKGISSVYYQSKLQHVFNIGANDVMGVASDRIFLRNTTGAPGDPTNGAHYYAEGGSLKSRTPGGCVVTLTPGAGAVA